jgi:hypothetical protein
MLRRDVGVGRATRNLASRGAVGEKNKEASMAFHDRPHDPRFDDPFREQRTTSLFDGPGFWFLVVLIIVITALALIYPGPGPQVGTGTDIAPVQPTPTPVP